MPDPRLPVRWVWPVERVPNGVPIAATYRPEDWQDDAPEQRIARILTDAGWTDATLGAETGNRRWATDDCAPDYRYMAVEHWHGWFCDAPYVGGPDGILEQPDFSEVAVMLVPRVTPIRKKRGKR